MNGGSVVGRVIIGTDPHKRSATIEVRDEREILLGVLDDVDYAALVLRGPQCPVGTTGCVGRLCVALRLVEAFAE